MKNILIGVLVLSQLAACSTKGGIYSSSDDKDNEFSLGRTLLLGAAAAIAVDAARNGGGGGGGTYENPKWDYLQASRTWACRNAVNGQFLAAEKCAGKPAVDNWPDN